MLRLRFFAALWATKAIRRLLRLMGRNSTHMPGKIGLRICPDFLGQAAKPERIIAVTGTNGKTTVCNLVCDVLEQNGYTVLNNRLGSNIDAGIATTLALGNTLSGKSKFNLAVLEVDERSSPKIYKYVTPDYLLITNLFRDSMMRNAHAEYIAGFINRGVPPSTKLILNGNDLISVGIAPANPRVYFGLDRLDEILAERENLICDVRLCPRCNAPIAYDYRFYHHIGKARCGACGYQSPDCDYRVTRIGEPADTITVTDKDGSRPVHLINANLITIYNTLAAAALLREFGLSYEAISDGLQRTAIIESRFTEVTAGGVKIVTLLAKELNPIACSRAFDYVGRQPEQKEVILDVYNTTDIPKTSEIIPWIYDADFEYLNRESITRIVVTGGRAEDDILRLLIAGVPEEKIVRCPMEEDALSYLELRGTESVYIIHGMDALAELAVKLRNELKDRLLGKAP